MTEAHIKESISKSYVKALAARAGISISTPDPDYGIDGTFRRAEYNTALKQYLDSGFCLDYQLKASINVEHSYGYIKYNLDIKNYRDLIVKNLPNPRILIVYEMPRDVNFWITVKNNETIFKTCAWWYSLEGQPEVANKNSVLIEIPDNQQFTPESLKELMQKVEAGVAL